MFRKDLRLPGDKSKRVPSITESFQVIDYVSGWEKFLIILFGIIFVVSTFLLTVHASSLFLVQVPTRGGTLTEGFVSVPRFINPLLATSDVDRSLSTLVYSGLLLPGDGNTFIYDMAKNVSISEDSLSYTVTLKDDLHWHDGEPITSRDVAFTVNLAQNNLVKSVERANWDGIETTVIDEHVIVFKHNQPYAPFLANLTLGIMPEHIWKGVDPAEISFSSLNLNPIGSGPYLINTVETDKSGIPKIITLSPFDDFALGKPYLEKITARFYANEDLLTEAFNDGRLDSARFVTPKNISMIDVNNQEIPDVSTPLPRIFAAFFNQSEAPILSNKEVRRALDLAINKQQIINEALLGYGVVVDGPLLQKNDDSNFDNSTTSPIITNLEEARELLENNGWKIGEDGVRIKKNERLSFTIATTDALPELPTVAALLEGYWEAIGAEVSVRIFEFADFNQNVIRPRDFDVLLFGTTIGRFPDPYAFWHSSQRLDPGLNIAQYTNSKVDDELETARVDADNKKREEALQSFVEEIKKDIPAVFLYAPLFMYKTPTGVEGFSLSHVRVPEDRFAHIYEWYRSSDKVWKRFSESNQQEIIFTPNTVVTNEEE